MDLRARPSRIGGSGHGIIRAGGALEGETVRQLRADAKLNEDRLIEAAKLAFARDGANASLKAIARDAGVGIGTLYRRFPTREQLIWAIYRSEVDHICASVPQLLSQRPPAEALRDWMESFLGFLAAKRGMADALKAALATDDEQQLETRRLITDALARLLEAGAADGTLRPDVSPLDAARRGFAPLRCPDLNHAQVRAYGMACRTSRNRDRSPNVLR